MARSHLFRWFLGALITAASILIATVALAGSYLDRAALLLADCRRSNDWVMSHLGDRELAAVARDMAEARVKVARKMVVPKEVVQAHPHLLLALENSERAAAFAADGDSDGFFRHVRVSRDEDGLFRSLLAQQKLQLPPVK